MGKGARPDTERNGRSTGTPKRSSSDTLPRLRIHVRFLLLSLLCAGVPLNTPVLFRTAEQRGAHGLYPHRPHFTPQQSLGLRPTALHPAPAQALLGSFHSQQRDQQLQQGSRRKQPAVSYQTQPHRGTGRAKGIPARGRRRARPRQAPPAPWSRPSAAAWCHLLTRGSGAGQGTASADIPAPPQPPERVIGTALTAPEPRNPAAAISPSHRGEKAHLLSLHTPLRSVNLPEGPRIKHQGWFPSVPHRTWEGSSHTYLQTTPFIMHRNGKEPHSRLLCKKLLPKPIPLQKRWEETTLAMVSGRTGGKLALGKVFKMVAICCTHPG